METDFALLIQHIHLGRTHTFSCSFFSFSLVDILISVIRIRDVISSIFLL